MILARVIGTLVATIKTESHENYKILVVRPVDLNGKFSGDSFIALDTAQAGIGDCVLIIQEGNSIRGIMKDDKGAVDALVVGIVDFIKTKGEQRDLTESYRRS
ncbi:MAG: EutN/CcmL family microcompartment protein [Candidatus Heimdallarchaeota archaeon]|nr:MAG: EutN/CcmL family microcompartment protein [Candidatus Heimdallarchaeota archaeon]